MSDAYVTEQLGELSHKLSTLTAETEGLRAQLAAVHQGGVDPFMFLLSIFILACFVGYYVVWKVTPALHTPLMSVTNAISGIIIVGAMVALGPESGDGFGRILGFIAVVIASINIFGGFVVSQRMLEMYKKKDKGAKS
jgi:NAD(P) transhydrogenase subunit alpha